MQEYASVYGRPNQADLQRLAFAAVADIILTDSVKHGLIHIPPVAAAAAALPGLIARHFLAGHSLFPDDRAGLYQAALAPPAEHFARDLLAAAVVCCQRLYGRLRLSAKGLTSQTWDYLFSPRFPLPDHLRFSPQTKYPYWRSCLFKEVIRRHKQAICRPREVADAGDGVERRPRRSVRIDPAELAEFHSRLSHLDREVLAGRMAGENAEQTATRLGVDRVAVYRSNQRIRKIGGDTISQN